MSRKKKKIIGDIPDKKLRELYDACDGRRSHHIKMADEPEEFRDLLVQEGWLTFLRQAESPWYLATQKLIENFRELSKEEKAQLAFQKEQEVLEELEARREDERAQKVIDSRKDKVKISEL